MPRRGYSGLTPQDTRLYANAARVRDIEYRNERDYREAERRRVDTEYYSNLSPSMGGDFALPAIVEPTRRYVPFGKADPRRQPDAQAIREKRARDYLDQLTQDMKDRYTLNKMLNRVVDVGITYGAPPVLENTLDMLEGLTGLFAVLKVRPTIPARQGEWVLNGLCQAYTRPPTWFTFGSYPAAYASSCLGGQTWSQRVATLQQVPDGHLSASWSSFNDVGGISEAHFTHLFTYTRTNTFSRFLSEQFQPQTKFNRYRNPNHMRFANATPQPFAFEAVQAAEKTALNRATQTAVVVQAAYGGATPPRLPPTLYATKSKPPSIGTDEGKGFLRRLGVAGAKILDLTSESAEVVDAIYRALPKDVRDKWDRPDRKADSIGQYGIAGADWKIQAIFHNYHKVDIAQAIQNIAMNEVEDRLIGGAMAARNRATRPDRFGSNLQQEVRRRRRTRNG
jgi:hypothetical protein